MNYGSLIFLNDFIKKLVFMLIINLQQTILLQTISFVASLFLSFISGIYLIPKVSIHQVSIVLLLFIDVIFANSH